MLKGNAIIGQSGGPTSVINASMVGAVDAVRETEAIHRVLGMRFGIEGVLGDFLLDLSSETAETLQAVRNTPSSALGSSRLKLKDSDLPQVLEQFKKYDIRYLFMVGGNDTMDTIHRVTQYARQSGYEMHGVGVCKTVDNDLFGTDHTPGYPSAARYVAMSVKHAGLLARDMQRVDQFVIFQTVGRSAGWLPAAAALARDDDHTAPHIILFPERPFDRAAFLAEVEWVHKSHGFVSIVCGEGISDANGNPISASQTRDKFNNVEFGAMGGTSAAMMLHRLLSEEFSWRGEFQVTESLQMSAPDRAVDLDRDEAYQCGREAVRLANAGYSGVMVTITRESKPGQPYRSGHGTIELSKVANEERPLPDEYISPTGFDVTPAFLDYVRPLVGELPTYGALTIRKAE